MTEKCNHDSHKQVHHQHSSGHGKHPAHAHNSWKSEEYEEVIIAVVYWVVVSRLTFNKNLIKKLKAMSYNGHNLVVEEFVALGIAKDAKILDLAAGTGLVGSVLSENGYTNIYALDGSDDMLVAAKNRQCYQNIILHLIKKDTKLPIEDRAYDHIIMSGALCHIDYENLPQIIRICKPGIFHAMTDNNENDKYSQWITGGVICWAIGQSEDLVHMEPKFMDGQFEKYIEKLCAEKVWEFLPDFPKRVNNYAMQRDGWVYGMKVL